MIRTIKYNITKEVSSIRAFLYEHHYSSKNLIKLKKCRECVILNGSPAFLNAPLSIGDTLDVHIIDDKSSENIVPTNIPLNIIYEDEDLIIIDKPAALPTHPSILHFDDTLANGLAYYYANQNTDFVFRCINRLDRDTSGLTIIAKHYLSAGILSQMIASKMDSELNRIYIALCEGIITETEGVIDAPIARKSDSIIEREVNFTSGERAITHYKVIDIFNIKNKPYSLIELCLETGRTHQIRVHMSHIGHPLIGDELYNPNPMLDIIPRQALHAARLSFIHPITNKKMDFTSELPSDIKSILS